LLEGERWHKCWDGQRIVIRKPVVYNRYSQEQLYTVVAGVEHYKEFVPWCQRSEIIITKPPGFVEAELEVGFKMFVERCASLLRCLCMVPSPGTAQ
jgi:ribosome-associated toxin RatA of RatAB toxin-antitoxin module